MENERLEITLLPDPNEGEWGNPKHRKALGDFLTSLRAQKVEVSPQCYVYDAVDSVGGLTGVFTILNPALPVLGAVLGAWLNSRYGRKARLKIGDIEAEAQTVEEVERLFKLARKYRKRKPR